MAEFKDIPKVVGMKQTLKQLTAGNVAKVILADDTDEGLKREITQACRKAGVSVIPVSSKRALGKESGIERSAAVVALLKVNHPSGY